jgi:hypothetical protein
LAIRGWTDRQTDPGTYKERHRDALHASEKTLLKDAADAADDAVGAELKIYVQDLLTLEKGCNLIVYFIE